VSKKIRITIAEDHVKYRDGLIELLSYGNIETIDVASDGKELIVKLSKRLPDILLLDLRMKEMDGDIAFDIIKEKYPSLKTIIQSQFAEESLMKEFMIRGANGYIPKDVDSDVTIKAIHDVSKGKKAFYFYDHKKKQFTLREAEIISKICEGRTNREIADDMYIALKTVEWHKKNLFLKTNSKNVSQLVAHAVRRGLDLVKRWRIGK
jgi:DNA-binding NarL/FixJ family response regulator